MTHYHPAMAILFDGGGLGGVIYPDERAFTGIGKVGGTRLHKGKVEQLSIRASSSKEIASPSRRACC
jgi:hypothetical protein